MAYKKYIKRGGKVYGPYIYHSKRVDGKVVSEYRGAHSKKIDYKKFLWIGLGILVLAVLIFGVSFIGNRISGQATFDVKVDYKEGEVIDGVLKLSLKEGELLPTSSKLVFENNGEKYEYNLADFVSDKTIEGDFYVEGKEISGSGAGYGKEGVSEVYPVIYFSLDIYSSASTEEVDHTPLQNPEEEQVEGVVEETQEEIVEEIEETPEETEEPGITGNVVSFLFGWVATGKVVMELDTEINGEVAVDNPFTYSLSEGQTAEIKSKSVRTDSEDLSDNVLDIEIQDDGVIITTDYSEKENGFGQDYLGESVKTLNIDLSNLNLILNEGELKVSLVYSGEELVSLTTVLQEGVTEEGSEEQPKIKEEKVEEPPEKEVIVPTGIYLTDEERAILIEEFGEINIETIREEIHNNRLIIGSKLRDYKIEHSYDYPQEAESLKLQIETDRTNWLKDIAATLSRKASVPQQVDIIEDNYII